MSSSIWDRKYDQHGCCLHCGTLPSGHNKIRLLQLPVMSTTWDQYLDTSCQHDPNVQALPSGMSLSIQSACRCMPSPICQGAMQRLFHPNVDSHVSSGHAGRPSCTGGQRTKQGCQLGSDVLWGPDSDSQAKKCLPGPGSGGGPFAGCRPDKAAAHAGPHRQPGAGRPEACPRFLLPWRGDYTRPAKQQSAGSSSSFPMHRAAESNGCTGCLSWLGHQFCKHGVDHP